MRDNSDRDNFLAKTRVKLALRANYRCSFPTCGIATSGPNDESPSKSISIGMAAHIHAAASNGPRYLVSMTPEERRDITNGIWMCRNHGTLIDEDTSRYTAEDIREMKRAHEKKIDDEITGRPLNNDQAKLDLIAIGPELIVIGELVAAKLDEWKIQIHHFVIGEFSTLVQFQERFDKLDLIDRYILVNALGDGRQLVSVPSFEKIEGSYLVTCTVSASVPRMSAHSLPRDFALNDANDIFLQNRDIAMVSGIDAFPQRIKSCLSLQRGESPFHPTFGAKLTKYFDDFQQSPWFSNLLKLEVIRQAAIPYYDVILKKSYTPLMSVSRVFNIQVEPEKLKENWILFLFDLEVEGVGRWSQSIPIFVP